MKVHRRERGTNPLLPSFHLPPCVIACSFLGNAGNVPDHLRVEWRLEQLPLSLPTLLSSSKDNEERLDGEVLGEGGVGEGAVVMQMQYGLGEGKGVVSFSCGL